jgi:predicted short-subunit dehydrogenase-like oxidoreductase (DUF2520 family)
LAWHPLQSFTGGETADCLQDVTVGIDGDEQAVALGKSLAVSVGAKPLLVPPELRVFYHLSGIFASNFTTAMAGIAAGYLQDIGLSEPESFAALEPIMAATVNNIAHKGVPGAISGPLVRDDRDTVARHLTALQARPEALAIYRQMSNVLLRYLGKEGEV